MTHPGDKQAFPRAPVDAYDRSGPALTCREYAAINLGVPDSGKEWLDKMILEKRRLDASVKAAAAILGDSKIGLSIGIVASKDGIDFKSTVGKCACDVGDLVVRELQRRAGVPEALDSRLDRLRDKSECPPDVDMITWLGMLADYWTKGHSQGQSDG